MAEPKKPPKTIDLDALLAARSAKVRYGRANLTIDRWGQVALSPIGQVLQGWREGKKSTDDVAWVYVKARVSDHTPSFGWDEAQLAKLLPLVTGVSREPKIKAKTADDLVVELDKVEKNELESLKRSQERMAKYFKPLSGDWSKLISNQFKITNPLAEQMKGSQAFLKAFNQPNPLVEQMRLPDNFLKAFNQPNPLAEQMKLSEGLLKALNQPKIDMAKLSGLGMTAGKVQPLIDPSVFNGLNQVTLSNTFAESFGKQAEMFRGLIGNQDWSQISAGFAELARSAGEIEIAEVVESTAEEAEEAVTLDADALTKYFNEKFESLERTISDAKDSPAQIILITIAAQLILILIQMMLAKQGIYIIPPNSPGP